MRDSLGRIIDYVRVSVTDRCNLRCVYCMPEDGVDKLTHPDILTYEEIVRICGVLAHLGVTKVKLTGGEPLVRRDVAELVARVKALPGIRSVTMTTNGHLLAEEAPRLRQAGLDGINISLDTLDADCYRSLTRGGDVARVLRSVGAAVEAGIPSVKLNCVPMGPEPDRRGLEAIAALARERDIQVRFIELMPMGLGAAYTGVDNRRVKSILEDIHGPMTAYAGALGNGPAQYWSLPGFRGKIGFISAVGGCFCERCNRVRLTADGTLKACLHADDGVALRHTLQDTDNRRLAEQIMEAVRRKPERHHFFETVAAEGRRMHQIGG